MSVQHVSNFLSFLLGKLQNRLKFWQPNLLQKILEKRQGKMKLMETEMDTWSQHAWYLFPSFSLDIPIMSKSYWDTNHRDQLPPFSADLMETNERAVTAFSLRWKSQAAEESISNHCTEWYALGIQTTPGFLKWLVFWQLPPNFGHFDMYLERNKLLLHLC